MMGMNFGLLQMDALVLAKLATMDMLQAIDLRQVAWCEGCGLVEKLALAHISSANVQNAQSFDLRVKTAHEAIKNNDKELRRAMEDHFASAQTVLEVNTLINEFGHSKLSKYHWDAIWHTAADLHDTYGSANAANCSELTAAGISAETKRLIRAGLRGFP